MRYTQPDSSLSGQRSVTETLLETLSQGGLRPAFSDRPADRRARLGRTAGVLAMLLAVAAASFVVLRPAFEPLPAPADSVATLEIVRGSVGVLSAGTRGAPARLLTLAAGEPIPAGAVIETRPGAGGAAGRAALRLADGPSLRIDGGSRVRLASRTSTRARAAESM